MHNTAFRVRVSDYTNAVVIGISAILLVAMLIISLTSIFYNLFIGATLSWPLGINRLILPWFAAFSVTVALKQVEHIAMDSVLKLLPPIIKSIIHFINYMVVGLIGIGFIWLGYKFLISSNYIIMVSSQFQVSIRWAIASIPVSGLIMCIHLLCCSDLLDTTEDIEQKLDELIEGSPE
jgi:TRAP-type C4-dicarboxylate transport system permease small subunit